MYSEQPRSNYPTKKLIYSHIDEIWSFDLADIINNKVSIYEVFRYIFKIIDICSEFLWAVLLNNKNSQTITNEFLNIITISKRSPLKIKSDKGAKFYNNIFQNFLKVKNIDQYSRFTDKGPSIAERLNQTLRNLLENQHFKKVKMIG